MVRGLLSAGTAVLVAFLAVGCGEHEAENDEDVALSSPSSVASAPTPLASATPAPAQPPTVAYTQDIQPILQADCVRCHSQLSTYAGTMGVVVPGSASSPLVQVTQPGGLMYSHLSGDRAAKSDLIRRWVVENGAAQSR